MPAALHRADGEAGQVEVAVGVHAGHLRRLAAHQRGTGAAAALGDAFDHPGGMVDRELAGREVVQEQQRLGPLADQVVDAHGDEVDADRIHQTGVDGDPELCPDPIGRGDQNGVGIPGGPQIEQRPEPAKRVQRPGPRGRCRGGLDALDQRVAGGDVDARLGIGQAVRAVGHGAWVSFARVLSKGPFGRND